MSFCAPPPPLTLFSRSSLDSCCYSGDEDGKPGVEGQNFALKDLNIDILPGQKVAICGRSGRFVPLSPLYSSPVLTMS